METLVLENVNCDWVDADLKQKIKEHNQLARELETAFDDHESKYLPIDSETILTIDPESLPQQRDRLLVERLRFAQGFIKAATRLTQLVDEVLPQANAEQERLNDVLETTRQKITDRLAKQEGIAAETDHIYHANPEAAKAQIQAIVRRSSNWKACWSAAHDHGELIVYLHGMRTKGRQTVENNISAAGLFANRILGLAA